MDADRLHPIQAGRVTKRRVRAVLYARVSSEAQDGENSASIPQQLADMNALCKRNEWEVVGVFIDRERYRKTRSPNRGKIVNPSGEYDDRPQFLAMLEVVIAGDVDAVVCWRDDRLVRHPRVAVALEDALDIGEKKSPGGVHVLDATGAQIDRFTLSIKATIWREENKRRAERTRMGKIATLQQGRWASGYDRYGYTSRPHPSGRGRIIETVEREAAAVLDIFERYAAGQGVAEIREHLIASGVRQKEAGPRIHDWHRAFIGRILRCKDYTGRATFSFGDGLEIAVEIPPIVPDDLYERVQAQIERNTVLSPRNAQGVYLLQGLSRCGDCGRGLSVSRNRNFREVYRYRCHTSHHNPRMPHPHPCSYNGPELDWAVWRTVVDEGLQRPDVIREQVDAKVRALQLEGNALGGEIARARKRVERIEAERAFYQRQGARGKLTEVEFDGRMDETARQMEFWCGELERLEVLRSDAEKVNASLAYCEELFATMRKSLERLDLPVGRLQQLAEEERNGILRERRTIIRSLVDRVDVYADGRVIIMGVLDGSEAGQFAELGR